MIWPLYFPLIRSTPHCILKLIPLFCRLALQSSLEFTSPLAIFLIRPVTSFRDKIPHRQRHKTYSLSSTYSSPRKRSINPSLNELNPSLQNYQTSFESCARSTATRLLTCHYSIPICLRFSPQNVIRSNNAIDSTRTILENSSRLKNAPSCTISC